MHMSRVGDGSGIFYLFLTSHDCGVGDARATVPCFEWDLGWCQLAPFRWGMYGGSWLACERARLDKVFGLGESRMSQKPFWGNPFLKSEVGLVTKWVYGVPFFFIYTGGDSNQPINNWIFGLVTLFTVNLWADPTATKPCFDWISGW